MSSGPVKYPRDIASVVNRVLLPALCAGCVLGCSGVSEGTDPLIDTRFISKAFTEKFKSLLKDAGIVPLSLTFAESASTFTFVPFIKKLSGKVPEISVLS